MAPNMTYIYSSLVDLAFRPVVAIGKAVTSSACCVFLVIGLCSPFRYMRLSRILRLKILTNLT